METKTPQAPDVAAKDRSSTLPRSNSSLFAHPGIREAIRGATGLSDQHVDRVAEALAGIGVALILPNGSDKTAKYANSIALVRDHGYSVTRAAREVGISATGGRGPS